MSAEEQGDAILARMIRSLERTPGVLRETMPKLGGVVKKHLVAANAAGVSPDDVPYQRTAEGHVPLRGGARAIRIKTIGTRIYAQVRGVEARHSSGTARGRIERPMLPLGGIPPEMARDLNSELAKHLREVFE